MAGVVYCSVAMPELPDVEHARRLAERSIAGKRIVKVATANDRIVYHGVTPRRFASALRGRRVKTVRRWGKHLWFELDRRPWPTLHFGMTGSFRLYRERRDRPRFWKLELLMDDGTRLAVPNMRRLGRIRLLNDPAREPPVSKLGFDPLLAMPTATTFAAALSRRKAPIKAVLLDQSFAAGVGNWIADEVLYQAHVAPHRRACNLGPDEAKRLRSCLGRIVRKAVAVDADKYRFPRTWLFPHRWGRRPDAATARGEKIIHQTIAGRTTAWVPAVQR
jgi:formamidopyrimidine-DNA glycosylase